MFRKCFMRTAAILVTAAMAGGGLYVPAALAQPRNMSQATALNNLGLFHGKGGDGFNPALEDSSTREEAMKIILSVIGEGGRAENFSGECPFEDVSDWAKPYVAYGVLQGITNGVSESMFGAAEQVTGRQFITFLLRALGYEGQNSNIYETAPAVGMSLGIIENTDCSDRALIRDEMVSMAYNALSVNRKGSDKTLIAQLTETGAVNQEAVAQSGIATSLQLGSMKSPIYNDVNRSYKERALDLTARMSLDEKAAQMNNFTPSIERLGVGEYIYQQESIHGWFGWADYPYTVFPVPIAMGASWDMDLIYEVGAAISDEARANRNHGKEYLNTYAPTINLARDPRWGRTEETYSEDPFLLAKAGLAYVQGMQGDVPKYLKTSTSIKHFVANNYEKVRHSDSSDVSQRDLWEYYFPAYRESIVTGKSRSLMSAYNALNGIPANVDPWLQGDVLRGQWAFDGFITSDAGDIGQTVAAHRYVKTIDEATTLSVLAGMDLDCGEREFRDRLPLAHEKQMITEADLDIATRRIMETRVLYGDLDPDPNDSPFGTIPQDAACSEENKQLARRVEEQGIVLLKNSDNLLPLDKNIDGLAIIGPYAKEYFLGGYTHGKPMYTVSLFDGVQKLLGGKNILHAPGANLDGSSTEQLIIEAVDTAKRAKTVILALGTNASFSSEGKDAENLYLPGEQEQLARRIIEANPRTVVVLCSGNPMSINWIAENACAILETWHGGQEFGNAAANVLFGNVNPSGKLPQTYYKNSDLLPALDDYDIVNKRLYMYYPDPENLLYPFGYGLSYTTFDYDNFKISAPSVKSYDSVTVSIDVTNTGDVAGAEVVQLYLKALEAKTAMPERALKGFQKLYLQPGETKTASFLLQGMDGAYYNEANSRFELESGKFSVMVGTSCLDIKQTANLTIEWAEPRFSGMYKLVNKQTGLSLQTDNNVMSHYGVVPTVGNFYGYNNQRWNIEQQGDETYRLMNVDSNGAVEAVSGDRVEIAIAETASEKQGFTITSADDRYYHLKVNGKLLSIDGKGGAFLSANEGGDAQKWSIVSVYDPGYVKMPEGWKSEQKVTIKWENTDRFLTARNNNFAITAPDTSYGAYEMFYIYDIGEGQVAIKAFASSKYLSVDQATGVITATALSVGDGEIFYMEETDSGGMWLKSKLSGKYVGMSGNTGFMTANDDTATENNSFITGITQFAPITPRWNISSNYNESQTNQMKDLNKATRWSTDSPMIPGMWIRIDLRNPELVTSVTLDSTASSGDYPRGYVLETSMDGIIWNGIAENSQVVSDDGVVKIDFPQPQVTRYIKITQTGSVENLYWSIHELLIDSQPVNADDYPVPTLRADNMILGGGAVAEGGYVRGFNNTNAEITIENVGGNIGLVELQLHYSAQRDGKLDLYLNNKSAGEINFLASENTAQAKFALESNQLNSIKIKGGGVDINMEYFTLTEVKAVQYSVEEATIGNGVKLSSNGKALNSTCLEDMHSEGGFCEFKEVDGGTGGVAILDIIYSAVGGARGQIFVNGSNLGTYEFTDTKAWDNFSGHVTLPIVVNAGTVNTIKIVGGDGGFNLDYIAVYLP